MKLKEINSLVESLCDPNHPLHDEMLKRLTDWIENSELVKNIINGLLTGLTDWINRNRPWLGRVNSFVQRMSRKMDREQAILDMADHDSLEAVLERYPNALSVLSTARVVELRLEPNVRTGRNVRAGGYKGHEMAYGNAGDKKKRWDSYQSRVDEIHKENPQLGCGQIQDKVAKEFKVSIKTIRRRTNNPFKD